MPKLILYDTNPEKIDGIIPHELILNKDKYRIGRGSTNVSVDFRISAKKDGKEILSRLHAEIHQLKQIDKGNSPSEFFIFDKGSLNGVFVNGIRIDKVLLKHQDVIQFGGAFHAALGSHIAISDLCVKYQFIDDIEIDERPGLALEMNSEIKKIDADTVRVNDNLLEKRKVNDNPDHGDELKRSKLSNEEEKVDSKEFVSTNQSASVIDQLPVEHDMILPDMKVTTLLKDSQEDSSDYVNYVPQHDLKVESIPFPNELEESFFQNTVDEDIILMSEKKELKMISPNSIAVILPIQQPIDPITLPSSSLPCPSHIMTLLKDSFLCILCQELLIDASVLPCSHTFCRVCLEDYQRKRTLHATSEAKSSSSNASHDCPICVGNNDDVETISIQSISIFASVSNTKEKGFSQMHQLEVYSFRCDVLDRLIRGYVDMDPLEKEKYSEREEIHRRQLRDIGIDSDQSITDQILECHQKVLMKSSSETDLQIEDSRCQYCNGKDHLEEDCPHDHSKYKIFHGDSSDQSSDET